MSTVPNVHLQACDADDCPGCYPDPGRPVPLKVPGESEDARRTRANRELLERGVHPATRVALADNGRTCGGCIHAVQVQPGARSFWKCDQHRLGLSRSGASDIRVSWPACTRFEAEGITDAP